MKKAIRKAISFILIIVFIFSLTACQNTSGNDKDNDEFSFQNFYNTVAEYGYTGTLEELIEAFKGDSAYAIAVAKGYDGSEADWLASIVGAAGQNGITPEIGENGNWYIGNTDTGVRAQGDKGDDGLSAYEIYKKYHPEYNGTEEEWIEDFVNGRLARYKVVFDTQGGNNIPSIPNLIKGSKITEPATPIRDNDVFLGWYKERKGINEWYFDDDTINSDITLYAKWEQHNAVIFYENGGTGIMANQIIATGTSANLNLNNYERDGYTFEGWATSIDGEVEFADGASYTMGSEREYILYAVWERIWTKYTPGLAFTLINGDTEYEVSGGTADKNSDEVLLPAEHLGKPVTSIGDFNRFKFSAITIPDNVTTIARLAFIHCVNLQNVTLSKNLLIVGDSAFTGCDNLTKIIIPSSVTTIEHYAFEYCDKLIDIDIPLSVTFIGTRAFSGNENMININVAANNPNYSSLNGVLFDKQQTTLICYPGGKIGEYTIPDTVLTIDNYAFYRCTNLTDIIISSSVTLIGNSAFDYCTGLTQLEIPDSVIIIGNSAFDYCNGLTNITIPNSVTTIGNSAFAYCDNLIDIFIPASVTDIGTAVFSNCDKLTGITVASDNPAYSSLNGVLFDKQQTVLISYPGGTARTYTIPNGVTTIWDCAFQYCDKITSVAIPASVVIIGHAAFYSCTKLATVSIAVGSSLTTIGSYAFGSCYSLTNITIPDSVTTICNNAFWYCSTMINIDFGVDSKLESIGNQAFYYCRSLISIDIPSGVNEIGSSAFFCCYSFTSISIPDNVTEIGSLAFYSCYNLVSVILPDGLTSISDGLFNGCTRLENLTIPSNVTSIGLSAFRSCTSLESLTIPESVTRIDNYAFFDWMPSQTISFEGYSAAPLDWPANWNDSCAANIIWA